MEIKAVGKNIPVSAIKTRIPVDIVRNMNALEAVSVLTYMRKGTAMHVKKVVESAISNAKSNFNINPENLYIAQIRVDKGPMAKLNVKRGIFKAKGRYATFDRKYCHIMVSLKEVNAIESSIKTKSNKMTEIAEAEIVDAKAKEVKENKTKKVVKAKNSVVKSSTKKTE